MLDKGKDLDWFNSPVIVALGVRGDQLRVLLIWELTEKNPIVDLRLFGGRNFLGGTIAISVAYAVFFGNLVLLPQWMQEYLNYRSVDAGLVTAPLGIFAVLLAPAMGEVSCRASDARVLATLGVPRLCGRVLHALALHDRRRYVARSYCRRCCKVFRPRYSLCRSPRSFCRVNRRSEDSGGGWAVEFRARVCRRGRDLASEQQVEQSDDPASRATR
jgi:hypothetical protein